ncbi:MAG: TonB-dependent receptor [Lentisphaeraceae bacterium]|nr:TonB-dependent receptor [Lentisphaeraceae bacterium]
MEPEEISNYEIVCMRYAEKWSAELTFFQSYWDNAIAFNQLGVGGGQYDNIGENESKGIELSAKYYDKSWNYHIAASWVKSKNSATNEDYESFPSYIIDSAIVYQFSGVPLRVQLSNKIMIDVKNSESTRDSNPQYLKNFWQTNVNFQWLVNDKLKTFINVKNIFDRRNYYASVWGSEDGIPAERLSVSIGIEYVF